MNMKQNSDQVKNYDMEVDVETTIKEVKTHWMKHLYLVDYNQTNILIIKEDNRKTKSKITDNQWNIIINVLNHDNKTLQYHDIHDIELVHLKVQLKLLSQIPCCRFSTMYVYTDNTLQHIQEKAINIFSDRMKNN